MREKGLFSIYSSKYIHFSDFERHDDDELGFRKNDIITIISQRDEHCWIGELNGLRGILSCTIHCIIFSKIYLRMVSCEVCSLVR